MDLTVALSSWLASLIRLVLILGTFGVMLRIVRVGQLLLATFVLVVTANLLPGVLAGMGTLGPLVVLLLLGGVGMKMLQFVFRAWLGRAAGDHLTASVAFEFLRLPFVVARGLIRAVARVTRVY